MPEKCNGKKLGATMLIDGFTKAEIFLERWSGLSAVGISFVTIAFSIVVPLFIYCHQRKETIERIRQSIISVIEEAEKECRDVKKIAELCMQVQSISADLNKMSSEAEAYEKDIQLAKIRLSEFKKISESSDSTDKMRNYLTVFVENRSIKMTIIKPGKKIRIRTLEECLTSIYSLIEANYKLRDSILKKIPETEIIFQAEPSEHVTKVTTLLSDVHNTFSSVDGSLAELEQNSRKIVETWEEFCLKIFWKYKTND